MSKRQDSKPHRLPGDPRGLRMWWRATPAIARALDQLAAHPDTTETTSERINRILGASLLAKPVPTRSAKPRTKAAATRLPVPSRWLVVGAGLSGAGMWRPASPQARLWANAAINDCGGRVLVAAAGRVWIGRIEPMAGAYRLVPFRRLPEPYEIANPGPGLGWWCDHPNVPPALMQAYLRHRADLT